MHLEIYFPIFFILTLIQLLRSMPLIIPLIEKVQHPLLEYLAFIILQKTSLGFDYKFNESDSFWFIGGALLLVAIYIKRDTNFTVIDGEEVKDISTSGILPFFRFGYAWKYVGLFLSSSLGKISTKETPHYLDENNLSKDGKFEFSGFLRYGVSFKYSFDYNFE